MAQSVCEVDGSSSYNAFLKVNYSQLMTALELGELDSQSEIMDYISPSTQLNVCFYYRLFWRYVPALLLFQGTAGNLLAFTVMLVSGLIRSTTYVYLAALALADEWVLLASLMFQWLPHLTSVRLVNYSNWSCKVLLFTVNAAGYISTWLIVSVTVERTIVTVWPLRARSLITMKRILIEIACIVLLSLVINSHFFFTVNLISLDGSAHSPPFCQFPPEYETFQYIWNIVDATLFSYLPFIIITSLNCIILQQLLRASSRRRQMSSSLTASRRRQQQHSAPSSPRERMPAVAGVTRTGSAQPQSEEIIALQETRRRGGGRGLQQQASRSNGASGGGGGGHNDSGSTRQLTVTMLVLCSMFLVTTSPIVATRLVARFLNFDEMHIKSVALFELLETISYLLMYVNHSVNFYLYCACGSQFRQHCFRLLARLCGHKPDGNTLLHSHLSTRHPTQRR